MRIAVILTAALLTGGFLAAPSGAQERLGVVQQPQTVAPSVDIPQSQASTCGRAPTAADLNILAAKARLMFPNPSGFDAQMAKVHSDPCPRSRAAAYLVHLISNNNWKLVR